MTRSSASTLSRLLSEHYPLTHDLDHLLRLVQTREPEAEQFRDLVEYNPYAVQFRYQNVASEDTAIDREEASKRLDMSCSDSQRLRISANSRADMAESQRVLVIRLPRTRIEPDGCPRLPGARSAVFQKRAACDSTDSPRLTPRARAVLSVSSSPRGDGG